MSIASEITRISGNIAAAYTALDGKGATLPATQNSANLADTIESISTGGGGSNPDADEDFIAMVNKIQSITTTVNTADWVYGNSSTFASRDDNFLGGFSFPEDFGDVYFAITAFDKLFLPIGATVDETKFSYNGSNCYKITFTGERWLIYSKTVDYTSSNLVIQNKNYVHPDVVVYGGMCEQSAGVAIKALTSEPKSIKWKNTDAKDGGNEYYPQKIWFSQNLTFSDTITTYGGDFWGVYRAMKRYYGGFDAAFDLFTNFKNTTSISASLLQASTNSTSFSYGSAYALENSFPYIIDFSDVSSSYKSGISSYIMNSNITNNLDVRIILPDNDWTWTGVKNIIGGSFFTLSKKALKFMHENAPTVSGKTLTLCNYCPAHPYWNTFQTAMEAKGWTVSTTY